MRERLKAWVKKLPFRFTKNQRYDHQTKRIIHTFLQATSQCVDVGCFRGEVLDVMLEACPQGTHYAFEPNPAPYDRLRQKYRETTHCRLYKLALSDEAGTTTFHNVVSNPAYSGIKQRRYDRPNEEVIPIEVASDTLDNILPPGERIDLIKIDVEGAELQVLRGASRTIARCRPIVIFEHGLGASEYYDATPDQVFAFFERLEMGIFLMHRFLKQGAPLKLEAFRDQFYQRKNHYFVASPRRP